MRLRSSNVMDKPLLDDVHLSDADSVDVATLREGIKLGRRLCTAPEFDQYRTEEVYPSASVQSDAEARRLVHRIRDASPPRRLAASPPRLCRADDCPCVRWLWSVV